MTERAGLAARRPDRSDLALRRTMALSALLVLGAAVTFVATGLGGIDGPADGLHLPWWVLAAAFAAAELCVFHIEVRREAHTFTLAEVPLVLGLVFASPLALLAGRLAGEALVLGLHERQRPRKLVLNLATFAAETTLALNVARLGGGDGVGTGTSWIEQPSSWLVLLGAVLAADALGMTCVGLVIRWHGGSTNWPRLLLANGITALTNTSLALAAALLLATNPASAVLLLTVVAVVVAGYRGYAALSQRFASLQLLYDFTLLMSGSRRPEAVLDAVLTKARELLRAERAGLRILGDPTTEAGEMWVSRDGDEGVRVAPMALPPDVVAEVTAAGASGTALVVPRGTKDVRLRRVADALGVDDCIVAALVDRNGPAGLLLVAGRLGTVSTFDAQDGRLFATLANHASVALENGRLIDRLHDEARQRKHQARHDALTGLPNRTLFLEHLELAVRRSSGDGATFAVALLDLDHFKEVNDTLGHHQGDVLLQEVARRLVRVVPSGFVAARLGGDEFALLVPAVAGPGELAELGRRVQDAIAQPFAVDGLRLEVGASLGIALYPEHALDAPTLLQRADVAMYTAKTSSTSRVEVYDPDRDTHTPRRLQLAGDLRGAVESGQLVLHYQPKARLRDGVISGAEALARWRHPELGFVPPEEFVPLAERTGLIQPFTDWVLSEAMRQVSEWAGEGLEVELSVNLSMLNLLDAGLPGRIAELLAGHAVDPRRLTFEITESNLMSEPARIIRTLHELAALGPRLSVDDFGTGYSSLAYLADLPVQEVKIDKSFVFPLTSDPGAAAIVRSVIDLAAQPGPRGGRRGRRGPADVGPPAPAGLRPGPGLLPQPTDLGPGVPGVAGGAGLDRRGGSDPGRSARPGPTLRARTAQPAVRTAVKAQPLTWKSTAEGGARPKLALERHVSVRRQGSSGAIGARDAQFGNGTSELSRKCLACTTARR